MVSGVCFVPDFVVTVVAERKLVARNGTRQIRHLVSCWLLCTVLVSASSASTSAAASPAAAAPLLPPRCFEFVVVVVLLLPLSSSRRERERAAEEAVIVDHRIQSYHRIKSVTRARERELLSRASVTDEA